MARTCHLIRLEGRDYRLRLTLGGQRRLRERFGEETLETVLLAPGDGERMCALLGEALSWPESGNPLTDGEIFYDLLVDGGYRGQERFGGLAFDIAAASGLITDQQARQLKQQLHAALEQAFAAMVGGAQAAPGEEANPPAPFPAQGT